MSAAVSTVTMYTTTWCGYCVRLKKLLQREGIEYSEVDIEVDEGAADLVMAANGGNRTVPTLVFADGTALTNPSIDQVKVALSQSSRLNGAGSLDRGPRRGKIAPERAATAAAPTSDRCGRDKRWRPPG